MHLIFKLTIDICSRKHTCKHFVTLNAQLILIYPYIADTSIPILQDKGSEEKLTKPKVIELLRIGAAILILASCSNPCSNLQTGFPKMELFKDRLPCSLCSFLYNSDYLLSHIQLLTPLPSNLTLPNKA